MGPLASGRGLDCFGDMFQAYFASMAIDALGGRFAFGLPQVRHERNPHALLRDLAGEISGMALLEGLLPYIETVMAATSAASAYRAIAEGLVDALPSGRCSATTRAAGLTRLRAPCWRGPMPAPA